MSAFPKKIYLQLSHPTESDTTADRERIISALAGYMPDTSFHMTASVLRSLYPLISDADYNVTVTLSPSEFGYDIIRIETGDTTSGFYGMALDIGSTTMELEIIDIRSETTLANVGCVNSQTKFGLNILDRIIAVKEDRKNLEELRTLTVNDVNRLIEDACRMAEISAEDISLLTVGGNTTMMHFFTGCDPWQVFQTPYTPAFYDPGILSAKDLGLNLVCNVFIMPAVANYLGGDITSGLLVTDLDCEEKPSILLDIGTNGELVLGCKDYMLMGAGAAGPALEGFGSASGMRAAPGAVTDFYIDDDGKTHVKTIDDKPPIGICGAGIFDLVAECWKNGWIDGSGKVIGKSTENIINIWNEEKQMDVPAIVYYRDSKIPDCPLYFTEDDIIEFIRCKAAAHTMVATLLDYCGLSLNDVNKIYLSGGFGTHINLESAITVGIYPDVERSKFVILGNSSLAGAKKLLLDESQLQRLKRFKEVATYLQFAKMDKFLENMVAAQFIPHTDASLYPSVHKKV